MLSYRHVFHAGNHADVLKHCVLLAVLDYLNQKDKPYWIIDTHAGAGGYVLTAGRSKTHAEWQDGIGRLWQRDDLPPLIARYVAAVRADNPEGKLRRYPGSPLFALRTMRPADRMRLFELHPADVKLLAQNIAAATPDARKRVQIRQEDGFAALKTLLPPPPRRGLVLIDPSYEDKRDYARVVAAVKEGLQRFATGTFMVWYPLLQKNECLTLAGKLKKLAPDWLHATLTIKAPSSEGLGMHGSAIFLINPPWTLAAQLKETLPWLADVLAVEKLGAGGTAPWAVEISGS
ncbi:23S rRNA (adenine(2030)-N(6))-methyltransferase RlmJ [Sulfuricystis multivorans]|uniref:23S rRNA (adenine(2030)-N(6))-methyltransferase RlmJ n=1 Tax=Sulfuricystis multivorans TaxID=2211108 RepID=UPI000F828EA9|nr:23S rRNA (adenine(2030)-N(6))-methyltransferase RlmJ [Sulfuricystis multivorans]